MGTHGVIGCRVYERIKDRARGKMRLGIYEPIANNGETEFLPMSVQIKPKALRGGWKQGFALDVHTTSSTFVGHNEYGRPEFATTRSPLGELLYRLKYGRDPSVIEEIVNTPSSSRPHKSGLTLLSRCHPRMSEAFSQCFKSRML